MKILFFDIGEVDYKGIEILSAVLKQKGHTVDLLLDPSLGRHYYLSIPFLNRFVNQDMLIKKVQSFNPDLIAMSIVTNKFLYFREFGLLLKKHFNIPVIVGGIHPTSLPEEVIKEDWVEMLCIGEGEGAMVELAEKMQKNEDITNIQNLWVKDSNGHIHKNTLRPLIKDLDSLPLPDRSIYAQYGVLGKRLRFMTGRGCPYHCSFCVNSFRNGLYPNEKYLRKRSVPDIIAELKEIKFKYQPRAIRFEDDVFVLNKQWLRQFKDEYKKHISLPFHCYITPAGVNEEIISDLKNSGCHSIAMGIQSGNEKLREQVMERKYSNEQVIEAANIIKKYNIKLYAEYMFGVPHETPEMMWETLELSTKIKANNSWASIFYPYPKTKLAEYCKGNKYIDDSNFNDILIGKGNPHAYSVLKHPFSEEAYKFKIILPLYNAFPYFRNSFKKLLKKRYGKVHKLCYIIGIPLLEKREFFYRIIRIPTIIVATRKTLKSR